MAHIPLRLNIDGEALVSNWRWLAAQSKGAACGAAVKADGYGIGAKGTVERLAAAGCRDFFVATWAEAEALLPWADGVGLSVLHGVGVEDMETALNSTARPVLNSPQQLARWRQGGGGACDIMVDTGMNRLGLGSDDLASGLLDGVEIHTLMSHLACADDPAHPLNAVQLGRFRQVQQAFPARRYSLANSAGICLGSDYAFDLTRPGLALYGGVPVIGDAGQEAALKQVVFVDSQLLQIREVGAGESVGYGATFVAPRRMKVGILNIGYADGFLRALGGAGVARAREMECRVIGRVSMDLLAIEVGGAEVVEGDWLRLDYRLPDLARASGLSQYELLTTLGHRHERIWV